MSKATLTKSNINHIEIIRWKLNNRTDAFIICRNNGVYIPNVEDLSDDKIVVKFFNEFNDSIKRAIKEQIGRVS